MAKNNLIFTLAILFALLILADGIRFTEGVRLSKLDKDEYYSGELVTKTLTRSRNKIEDRRGIHGADAAAVTTISASNTKDLQATTPGHSPGTGHSTPPNGHN
ncbi:hypothetical protein Goshw_015112 [Gossypium schwendimanii]|uniref:Uncharacterized protein n=1 Tax=Gossypium schwendimanii TaxID=34291 RepID=A0A7J9MYU5_GOSSC|nr:hypothetical protein [Gossypium schwendimanii]